MNITIREAKTEDALQIAEINIASWHSTYRGLITDATLDDMKLENYIQKWNMILTTLDRHESFCFVAENERHEIIGYALCGRSHHEKFNFELELFAIYIMKEYQGKGAGSLLFHKSIDEAKQRGFHFMLLFVLSSNKNSRKFYESFKPDFSAEEQITIDNLEYSDHCYGWSDLSQII